MVPFPSMLHARYGRGSSFDRLEERRERSGDDWAMVRFWQPASEAGTELVCAYLETSEGPPHLHEEWQFGVLEAPSKLSLGAYRRYGVRADDVTIVPPYDVHSERGVAGTAPRWRMLYVAPSIVSQSYGRKVPR